ncbi:MAG: alpha/beta hydrolase [Myxococcales bacterium]|nr:MAG: alpha/beta hydrolase [Myxococcales bacterium]
MASRIICHNARTLGSGPRTLVFGHGLGTDQSIWRLVAPRMAVDHRVVLLDWAGCGHSDPQAFDSGRHASLRGHAHDLCELLAEEQWGPVTYVGHSAGGMIGVLAAIEQPWLFEQVVLLAASPRYLDDPPHYVGGSRPADVAALFELMDQNFLGWSSSFAAMAAKDSEVQRTLEGLFNSSDRGRLREFAESVMSSDFRAVLPELTLPALVMGTAEDDMVPTCVGEYLHAHLAGSTYVCLNLAGHCPQMTHPQQVEAELRTFMAKRPA